MRVTLLGAGEKGHRGAEAALPTPAAAPHRDAGAENSPRSHRETCPWVSRCHPPHRPYAGMSPPPLLNQSPGAGAVPGFCRWKRGQRVGIAPSQTSIPLAVMDGKNEI